MANRIWNVTKWIWLALIVAIGIAYIANVLPTPAKDFASGFPASVLGWLILGPYRILTLSILGALLIITLTSGTVAGRGGQRKSNRSLKRYLRSVIEANQGLSPKGFAQQSQALISVNVPLDTVFIHLRTVPDRPVYDVPGEQQKLLEKLEELRHRSDLNAEELEENIQRLRVIWSSQIGQEALMLRQRQNATIEDVLEQLRAANPVAVILGAPGSGKSTTMRWLALHMARACLLHWYRRWLNTILRLLTSIDIIDTWFSLDAPSQVLSPKQVPILLRISDYAKRLSTENLPFQQFFTDYFDKTYPNLPRLSNRLLGELEKGRCLLLFDGLDEVANDSLRRRVAENIQTFISDYSRKEEPTAQRYNRFIVTSRIVGYEPGSFNTYAHYTLLDLEDEQIEQFLTNWCPAVERYQMMFAQGMRPLTTQQETQAGVEGKEQRDRLWAALQNSPGIKRLAVNPLMLTALALIQRSGRTLPHRRIELYQLVTRTLLDNWNQETGRRIFSSEEVPLAEQLLSNLAYRLHTSDPVLTEPEVRNITSETMADFYKLPTGQIKIDTVHQFVETLRSSSGLFVESGQGLFSFMHRTFQEYFVALYLIDKQHYTPEALKAFVATHHRTAIWREPLLLAIAYKSEQRDRDERQQANDLIEAIAETRDDYETFLQRSLLFAARCIVDCSAWSIDGMLQQRIAYRLLHLYGDSLGAGRYTQLQKDIEEVALLWLRGQPQSSSQHDTLSPLLEAWRSALCNDKEPLCQQGAVHLLASLAPDLSGCPTLVLQALIPQLLHLAELQDLPCPAGINVYLPRTAARPASQTVVEYAFVALRLLDAAGPAGWLHGQWLQWAEQQPELLDRLSQHSLELGYLMTPAALPGRITSPHWDTQLQIYRKWQQRVRRDPRNVYLQLLHASDAARYPHAFLYKQMLDQEPVTSPAKQPWQMLWNAFLQKEMAHGRSTTYQPCLHLRLLLSSGNLQQLQEIANELMAELSTHKQRQAQALVAITQLYQRYLPYLRDLRGQRYPLYLRYLPQMRNLVNMLEMRNLRNLLNKLEMRNLVNMLEMRNLLNMPDMPDMLDMRNQLEMRDLLNQGHILDLLCSMLLHPVNGLTSAVLLALDSVVTSYESIPTEVMRQVQTSIQAFAQPARHLQPLSLEHRLLTAAILRRITPTRPSTQLSPAQITPDAWVTALHALTQLDHLTKPQVEELLKACADTRELSQDKKKEVKAGSIQEVAWGLLSRPFTMEEEALSVVVQALDDNEAIVCAASARLLKSSKTLPQRIRKEVTQKSMRLLADDELSHRPLYTPDYDDWRLDDLLFEMLQVLAE